MKIFRNIFIIFVIIIVIVCIAITGVLFYQKNKTVYYAEDFGIETLISQTDYDHDGIDDYTDIRYQYKIVLILIFWIINVMYKYCKKISKFRNL